MRALFDLTFKRFVAPSIVKIIYILIMIATAIVYLGLVVVAFAASTALGVLTLLIIGPILAFLYLIMARVFLESVIAQIRTAENTRDMLVVMQGGVLGGNGGSGFPGPQGPPPGPNSGGGPGHYGQYQYGQGQ